MTCRRPGGGDGAARHRRAGTNRSRGRPYAARRTIGDFHHLSAPNRGAGRSGVSGRRRACFCWAWHWLRYWCRTNCRRYCETARNKRLKTLSQRRSSLAATSDDKVPSSIRTIVISNLEPCMNHLFFHNCFGKMCEVTGVLLEPNEPGSVPNKAFVEFSTHAMARKAKEWINCTPRPDKGFCFFEMQWASANLDRNAQGKCYVTYKSDESTSTDTAITLESESSDSDNDECFASSKRIGV